VTLRPEDEAPRADEADAVTFAFADLSSGVSGLARVGFAEEGSSGLAVLFAGADPVAAAADSSGGTDGRAWEAVSAGGVRTTVVEPLRAWTVAFDDGAGHGFELEVSAISDAGELGEGVGGMMGYEHLCRVEGTARAGKGAVRVACLGQRSRLWGSPDWQQLELTRSVGVWLDGGSGVALHCARPAGARGQDEETVRAFVFDGEAPAAALPVDVPRLSTISDLEGHQRRAGLELYVAEEDFPRRAAGELIGGTSLDLGRLRLDCAFLRWRMEGRSGAGRYDILRRVA
jgi:hypothetical protein